MTFVARCDNTSDWKKWRQDSACKHCTFMPAVRFLASFALWSASQNICSLSREPLFCIKFVKITSQEKYKPSTGDNEPKRKALRFGQTVVSCVVYGLKLKWGRGGKVALFRSIDHALRCI